MAQKLGIKPGANIHLAHAPAGFELDRPPGVTSGAPPYDVVLAFFAERDVFAGEFVPLAASLQPAGGLWIAWPKRSSGVPTDLNENIVRELGLAGGLVDNKVCAVTEVWSGLRFVYRLKDRAQG